MYRLEPENVGGKTHFPFLPPIPMAHASSARSALAQLFVRFFLNVLGLEILECSLALCASVCSSLGGMSKEVVLSLLVLCFLVTIGGWWIAANSKRSPDPDYVVPWLQSS